MIFSLIHLIQLITTVENNDLRNISSSCLERNKLQMVRVSTFLGCIHIETGGVCLGWFFFVTFLVATAILFIFGSMSIAAKRKLPHVSRSTFQTFFVRPFKRFLFAAHPLYALIWLDIIIFWIIVIYASWLMIQGIKTVGLIPLSGYQD